MLINFSLRSFLSLDPSLSKVMAIFIHNRIHDHYSSTCQIKIGIISGKRQFSKFTNLVYQDRLLFERNLYSLQEKYEFTFINLLRCWLNIFFGKPPSAYFIIVEYTMNLGENIFKILFNYVLEKRKWRWMPAW